MTSLGSGLTSNIGSPQQPSVTEMEASAWTQVNKSALGILKDSLEVPFSQLGGQIWKYKSDANRPTLVPTGTTRTLMPKEDKTDESWKPFFDDLVSKMHPQMRARLTADMKKPFETRNTFYSVLENVLNTTAKGLASLERAQQPQTPEQASFKRTLENQALIGTALVATSEQSEAMLNDMQQYLEYLGPNFPGRDALKPFIDRGQLLQEQFNQLLAVLKNPKAEFPEQKELSNLADQAIALSKEFAGRFRGNDLQMLGPLFETMATVAAALSMTPASPTLFMGLKIAGKGIFDSTGMLGPQLQALIKGLSNGLFASLLSKAGSAKEMMMLMMLLASLYGSTSLAGLISQFGLGRYPSEDEEEEESGQLFTMELLMILLANSGLIKQYYAILTRTCGSTEKTEEVITSALELVTLLLAALSGAKGKTGKALYLLKSIKGRLGAHINVVESFLNQAIQTSSLPGPQAKALDVALKQAKTAIQNDQIEGLIAACKTAMNAIGSSPDLLKEDLEQVKEFVILIQRSCSTSTAENNAALTGMITTA